MFFNAKEGIFPILEEYVNGPPPTIGMIVSPSTHQASLSPFLLEGGLSEGQMGLLTLILQNELKNVRKVTSDRSLVAFIVLQC